jgi:hypothetical protein
MIILFAVRILWVIKVKFYGVIKEILSVLMRVKLIMESLRMRRIRASSLFQRQGYWKFWDFVIGGLDFAPIILFNEVDQFAGILVLMEFREIIFQGVDFVLL